MSTIGIVTLFRDNFGSILQAYATYSFLETLGYNCIMLEQCDDKPIIAKARRCLKILYKSIRYKGYFREWKERKGRADKEKALLSLKTKKLMNDFISTNFQIQKYNSKEANYLNDKFDAFIVGSDQIWNGYSDFAFLRFTNMDKRIALAPSFGMDHIDDNYEKEVKEGLLGFRKLSCREETGVTIIKKLTGKTADRLPDPTLIYNKEEWGKLSKGGLVCDNYILCHFLNEPNEIAIDTIKQYILENKRNVICIANDYEKYSQFEGYIFLDIDPFDYISLIIHSDCVFTDSFHSTLFSINFQKMFTVFERQYMHNNPQTSRIIDLLERIGMQERFMTEKCLIGISPPPAEDVFADERERIRRYITQSIARL